MTVQDFQADAIQHAGELMAHFLATTALEKQDWVPPVEGAAGVRSALDQVAECIAINHRIAATLRGNAPATPMTSTERPFTSTEEAQDQLIASAKDLAEAVRGMSDVDMEKEYTTRRGPMKGCLLIQMPFRNMHYHCGQINLLQLLYGDTEFRPVFPKPKE